LAARSSRTTARVTSGSVSPTGLPVGAWRLISALVKRPLLPTKLGLTRIERAVRSRAGSPPASSIA